MHSAGVWVKEVTAGRNAGLIGTAQVAQLSAVPSVHDMVTVPAPASVLRRAADTIGGTAHGKIPSRRLAAADGSEPSGESSTPTVSEH